MAARDSTPFRSLDGSKRRSDLMSRAAIGPSRRVRAFPPHLRCLGVRVFELPHLLGLDERAFDPQRIDQALHGYAIAVPAGEGRRTGRDALFSPPYFLSSCSFLLAFAASTLQCHDE